MKSETLRSYVDHADRFREGSSSPRHFLEECIASIEARDSQIGAFTHLNLARARDTADAATTRWKRGAPLSAIDGMPIGVKDIIETADMPTEEGSPLFTGRRTGRDAACIVALRDAGAALIGKTVTTEFAATHPGKTRNPLDLARTPGGSSSGSAAGVAAGMISAGLGTQVIGSTIRPASYCGCYGFKPTFGSLNRAGSFDHKSHSVLTTIAASLEECWIVAREISARAGGDSGHPGLLGPRSMPAATRPQRLAVLETAGWAKADPQARESLAAFIDRLRKGGIAVENRATNATIEEAETAIAQATRIAATINVWEDQWPLNTYSRDLDHSLLSGAMQRRLQERAAMTQEDYAEALIQRARTRETYDKLASQFSACLTLSATGAAPLGIEWTGDPTFAIPGSLLGVPALNLPLLQADGMPVGMQLLGFSTQDAEAMQIGRWICETSDASGF